MTLRNDEKTMPLSDIVPEYNSSFFLVRNLFWDRIKYSIQLGRINDGKKILDVGCGIGYLLKHIRKKNKKCYIVGIDFNININKLSIPDCEFRVEDVTKLSFKDDSFDIVYALDALEHINDIASAINQIKRVLKPNGKLIITGPTESFFYKFCRFLIKGTFSEEEGPGTGIHYHTIDSLDKKIKKRNFIKEVKISLPKFFPFKLIRVIKYTNKKLEI